MTKNMTSTSSQSAIACIYALTVPFIMAIPNYKHGDTETLALALYKSKQPIVVMPTNFLCVTSILHCERFPK